MKPSKHRKHVIFDDDIFQFFESLSGDNGSKFSSMINSALRSFVRERLISNSKDHDPVAELLSIRERERVRLPCPRSFSHEVCVKMAITF